MVDIPITKDKWHVGRGGCKIVTTLPGVVGVLGASKTVAEFTEYAQTREEAVANTVLCSEAPEMLYVLSEIQDTLDDSRELPEALKRRLDGVLRSIRGYRRFL